MEEMWKEIEAKRLAVLEKHMANGVIFEGVDGVVIEESVAIGAGTRISPNVTLRGNTSVGKECVLTGGTVLENCSVGDRTVIRSSECFGARIGSGVSIGPFAHLRPGTVLGDRVHVGNFVEIKNSSIGEGTAVAHLTYVGDSDVGRHVNFGCGCVTVNYDGEHKHRCRIGDYAFIGCNANLIAPVAVRGAGVHCGGLDHHRRGGGRRLRHRPGQTGQQAGAGRQEADGLCPQEKRVN